MNKQPPVSIYCNQCDKWFQLLPEDQAKLMELGQLPCEDCGNPIYLPRKSVRQRIREMVESLFQ